MDRLVGEKLVGNTPSTGTSALGRSMRRSPAGSGE